MRLLARIVVAVVAAGLAGGCYMPTDFKADLRITPDGNYNFRYEGSLVYLPMLQKLDGDEPAPDARQKQIAAVEQDLARDAGFEEISYTDLATFRVRYKRVGNIVKEKTFTFVRFNSRLLTIERHPNGEVRIFADKPNTEIVQRLEDRGFAMRGQLRIQTEAKVKRHNAGAVRSASAPIYVWPIDGPKSRSPELVFRLPPQ